ncbi:hypothetical protein [Kitasatospora sp. GP82]|nr:hypothetical protein [Kitasatospora sp. GP82]
MTDLAEHGFKALLRRLNNPMKQVSWETTVDGRTAAGWVKALRAEHG